LLLMPNINSPTLNLACIDNRDIRSLGGRIGRRIGKYIGVAVQHLLAHPMFCSVSTGVLSCFVGRLQGVILEVSPVVDVGGSVGRSGTTSNLVSGSGSRDRTTGSEERH
jgi:hypothetical protein